MNYIKKKSTSLLLPYYGWNIFYGLLINILTPYGFFANANAKHITLSSFFLEPWTDGHQYIFNIASWFLLILFAVQISYVSLRIVSNIFGTYREYGLWVVIFIAASAATLLAQFKDTHGIMLPVLKTFFCLFFYHMGYIYKITIEKYDKVSLSRVVIVILIQIVLVSTFKNPTYQLSWCNFNDRLIVPYITSLTGIWINLQLAKILAAQTTSYNMLINIGKNSFSIMVHHLFGYWILNTVYYSMSIYGLSIFKSFDSANYLNNIYYAYPINGWSDSMLIYIVFALLISFFIKRIVEYISHVITDCRQMYIKPIGL